MFNNTTTSRRPEGLLRGEFPLGSGGGSEALEGDLTTSKER